LNYYSIGHVFNFTSVVFAKPRISIRQIFIGFFDHLSEGE